MAKTSLHDKKVSNEIMVLPGVTFYGVFLTLIGLADSDNLIRLERAFPEVVKEAKIRYFAPDGCLNLAEWEEKNGKAGQPILTYLEEQFKKARVKAASGWGSALKALEGDLDD